MSNLKSDFFNLWHKHFHGDEFPVVFYMDEVLDSKDRKCTFKACSAIDSFDVTNKLWDRLYVVASLKERAFMILNEVYQNEKPVTNHSSIVRDELLTVPLVKSKSFQHILLKYDHPFSATLINNDNTSFAVQAHRRGKVYHPLKVDSYNFHQRTMGYTHNYKPFFNDYDDVERHLATIGKNNYYLLSEDDLGTAFPTNEFKGSPMINFLYGDIADTFGYVLRSVYGIGEVEFFAKGYTKKNIRYICRQKKPFVNKLWQSGLNYGFAIDSTMNLSRKNRIIGVNITTEDKPKNLEAITSDELEFI